MHKTKLLKRIGGYHTDVRPFFKSSDFLTIYKTLLVGKLGFVHRVLFYKRDTGLFTKEYENLRHQPMNKLTKNITRYALFPLHYIFDFIFAAIYLSQSDMDLCTKMKVHVWLTACTGRLFQTYISKSSKGILILLKRIIRL